mgnify:CR=1 FL=1
MQQPSFFVLSTKAKCYNKNAIILNFQRRGFHETEKTGCAADAGATLLTGTAFAAGSPASPFKPDEQVYPKGELFTFDKQDVAKGKGTAYGKFAFARDKLLRIPPSRKSAI